MKKTLLAAIVASSFVAPLTHATTNIDVLGVYTTETAQKTDHITAIQHRFNVGNKILKDSKLDIKVNLAGLKEYNFDSEPGRKQDQGVALEAITPGYKQSALFRDIEQVRKDEGADMVAMFRYLDLDNSPDYERTANGYSISCGVAWVIPAFQWNGNQSWAKSRMYSHTYINECGGDTFIHELGHNFGINHAREQYNGLPHLQNGTEKDAYGYGVNGQFATTMAYGYLFGIRGRSYNFSNPEVECKGQPCGRKGVANAARAIGLTAPKIANIYQSKTDGTDTGKPTQPIDPKEPNNVFKIDSPVAIPDQAQVDIPLKVSFEGEITKPTIALNVEHEFIGDLSIRLIAPDNSYWNLKEANSRDRGEKYNVTFTLQDIEGIDFNGQWTLRVTDKFERDTGVVKNAILTLK
ncbi:endo-1,4-beta-xylanase [Vibrio sp. vnigr-6D03]|uniref:zinc-dependent metalloprotease family protein n=1 Tax=Vibrio sp. vnigr-6D03 TaxID=2058088 RepID=UPI000C333694|nr:zinc-dependent metalloprotease family protein [Vibrio sp. vnigr-6D03]PKF79948.1 endo-1,4-beta-xylanase [Vibrio sp. vnigr-6D03]